MSLFSRPLFFLLTVFLHLTFAAIARRGDDVSTVLRAGASTSTVTALTFITPSPGADPIPITSQVQVVTSYIPVMTICPLIITQTAPALLLPTPTLNATSRGTAASNAAVSSGASLHRRQAVEDPDAPYANASIPTSVLTACSVSYTPTTSTICHTTLSPLASPVIPITNCYQRVTFSTDHGYTLVAPSASRNGNISFTAAMTVQTLESYYVAPWQYIYTGVPADAVDKVVCSTSAGVKECTTTAEDWAPGTGWVKATNTISLSLGAPVTGVRPFYFVLSIHVSHILSSKNSSMRLTYIKARGSHCSPLSADLYGAGRRNYDNVSLNRLTCNHQPCYYDHRPESSQSLGGGGEQSNRGRGINNYQHID